MLAEQLTRNVQFFGEEPQQRIADAFVVIVGLGGVGSHAAHMLLRSGVGRLRLIDFDQVGASMTPELAATGTEGGLKTLMVNAHRPLMTACLHSNDPSPEADDSMLALLS